MSARPTPEEVEDFLRELPDLWDYEMEMGNLFDDEPDDEEPGDEEEFEEVDRGWRERDFV